MSGHLEEGVPWAQRKALELWAALTLASKAAAACPARDHSTTPTLTGSCHPEDVEDGSRGATLNSHAQASWQGGRVSRPRTSQV